MQELRTMKLSDLFSKSTDDTTLEVVPRLSGLVFPMPYKDVVTEKVSLCAATVFGVKNVRNGNDHNVVVACRYEEGRPDYSIWCGDPYLEGTMKRESPDDRIAEVEADTTLSSAHLSALKTSAGMLASAPSSGCHFWAKWQTGQVCKHVAKVLHCAEPKSLEVLGEKLALFSGSVAAPTPAGSADWRQRLPFRVPVLLQGDRGSGKTTEAFSFARSNGLPLKLLAGHEGMLSVDMLGHYVPHGTGELIWKDGPLAEAFRAARDSKVVLLIDEMLRIPQRELSVLLTALAPLDGQYVLKTGRMTAVSDGVGTEEMLSVPVSNLCVFATTNVGGQYAVDAIDPALAERFVPIEKNTDEVQLRSILRDAIVAKGWVTALADQCMTFYTAMHALVDSATLNRAPTTRTMVRAVDLATSDKEVRLGLEWQRLLWVDLDSRGRPDESQLKAVNDALATAFKEKK